MGQPSRSSFHDARTVFSTRLNRLFLLDTPCSLKKCFCAWDATWVGVRVGTKYLETPLQFPFPSFFSPTRNARCSDSVHGTPVNRHGAFDVASLQRSASASPRSIGCIARTRTFPSTGVHASVFARVSTPYHCTVRSFLDLAFGRGSSCSSSVGGDPRRQLESCGCGHGGAMQLRRTAHARRLRRATTDVVVGRRGDHCDVGHVRSRRNTRLKIAGEARERRRWRGDVRRWEKDGRGGSRVLLGTRVIEFEHRRIERETKR